MARHPNDSHGPMTKGEARTYLNEAKKALRRAEYAIRHGRVHDLADEVRTAGGCAGEVESAIERGDLDHWKTTCAVVKEGGQVCGLLVAPGFRECLPHRGPNR